MPERVGSIGNRPRTSMSERLRAKTWTRCWRKCPSPVLRWIEPIATEVWKLGLATKETALNRRRRPVLKATGDISPKMEKTHNGEMSHHYISEIRFESDADEWGTRLHKASTCGCRCTSELCSRTVDSRQGACKRRIEDAQSSALLYIIETALTKEKKILCNTFLKKHNC